MNRRLLSNIVLATALLLGRSACAADEDEATKSEVKATAAVKTQPIVEKTLSTKVTCYGVVAYDPSQTVNISFPRAGQVESISVLADQAVQKGDALTGFGTDPADRLNYQLATAAVIFARQQLARTEKMAGDRLATQSQLEEARKTLADANATLKEQKRLGTDKEHESAIAPFAGVVRAVNVSAGDHIAAGAAILQLSPDDSLVARLGVEPEDSHRIKAGAAATVSSVFDAHSIAGRVHSVHRVINPQTRMVDVLVDIKGEDAAFFMPAMQVTGEIALESRTSLVAPRSAVLRDEGGAYIFQVKDEHAHKVYVQTGIESGGSIGISGDFDRKLEVVTEGNYELEEGMAVRREKP